MYWVEFFLKITGQASISIDFGLEGTESIMELEGLLAEGKRFWEKC